ncbi:hypothetical protein NHX12_031486 [Muraenolepis orangiensis]|uniref:Uncharacterized protein n=1 Tax=Muraenolepis orangiensis TaxID=630683 RepID=A0A9Q0IJQ3_9TELE|nr:hypothetical protein NHX12_031486 [Muraenolepis orangiensis]
MPGPSERLEAGQRDELVGPTAAARVSAGGVSARVRRSRGLDAEARLNSSLETNLFADTSLVLDAAMLNGIFVCVCVCVCVCVGGGGLLFDDQVGDDTLYLAGGIGGEMLVSDKLSITSCCKKQRMRKRCFYWIREQHQIQPSLVMAHLFSLLVRSEHGAGCAIFPAPSVIAMTAGIAANKRHTSHNQHPGRAREARLGFSSRHWGGNQRSSGASPARTMEM